MKALRQALLLVLFLALVDALFGFGGLIVLPLHFAFGWTFSLTRAAQHFQPSWTILWWSAALIAFVLFLYWFCAGFSNERARLRTVAAVTGASLFVIVAGMSLAGSVHQVAWLANSNEPWLRSHFTGRRSHMAHAALFAGRLVEIGSTREQWEKEWRRAPENDELMPVGGGFHSRYATHLRSKPDGTVQEVVLWPRNGDDFRKIGGVIARRDDGQDYVSREKLLAYLQASEEPRHDR